MMIILRSNLQKPIPILAVNTFILVSLESARGGTVPGEGLEIPDGVATLREEREATMSEVVEANGREPPASRAACSGGLRHSGHPAAYLVGRRTQAPGR